MFSEEYIIGKFLVRFGVHRTYAESGVQSQSWPSFSTHRQHFTRSRKIASLGSPTKNKDISINASYDNHWCHIMTHPNNKVFVKYDPCVCFIMSTIQFVNLSIFCSAIFSCVIIAFLINGEVQLMPIKDRSIYERSIPRPEMSSIPFHTVTSARHC